MISTDNNYNICLCYVLTSIKAKKKVAVPKAYPAADAYSAWYAYDFVSAIWSAFNFECDDRPPYCDVKPIGIIV